MVLHFVSATFLLTKFLFLLVFAFSADAGFSVYHHTRLVDRVDAELARYNKHHAVEDVHPISFKKVQRYHEWLDDRRIFARRICFEYSLAKLCRACVWFRRSGRDLWLGDMTAQQDIPTPVSNISSFSYDSSGRSTPKLLPYVNKNSPSISVVESHSSDAGSSPTSQFEASMDDVEVCPSTSNLDEMAKYDAQYEGADWNDVLDEIKEVDRMGKKQRRNAIHLLVPISLVKRCAGGCFGSGRRTSGQLRQISADYRYISRCINISDFLRSWCILHRRARYMAFSDSWYESVYPGQAFFFDEGHATVEGFIGLIVTGIRCTNRRILDASSALRAVFNQFCPTKLCFELEQIACLSGVVMLLAFPKFLEGMGVSQTSLPWSLPVFILQHADGFVASAESTSGLRGNVCTADRDESSILPILRHIIYSALYDLFSLGQFSPLQKAHISYALADVYGYAFEMLAL